MLIGILVNSNGTQVSTGCICNSGYRGNVTKTTVTPFYTSSCSQVACPTNSKGAPACFCNNGYLGAPKFNKSSQVYEGSCDLLKCPVPPTDAPACQCPGISTQIIGGLCCLQYNSTYALINRLARAHVVTFFPFVCTTYDFV